MARVALATHDARLRVVVLRDVQVDACEMLLGVRSADAVQLARAGRPRPRGPGRN